jgi:hypothetical protein
VTPYIGVYVVRTVFAHGSVPGFSSLFGTGQLLLTSVALVGGGMREIAGARHLLRVGRRDFLLLTSTIFVLVTAMVYGAEVSYVIQVGTPPAADQEFMTKLSAGFLALSIVVGGGCIAVTTPKSD